jgi:NAD(P)H-flavin reductase
MSITVCCIFKVTHKRDFKFVSYFFFSQRKSEYIKNLSFSKMVAFIFLIFLFPLLSYSFLRQQYRGMGTCSTKYSGECLNYFKGNYFSSDYCTVCNFGLNMCRSGVDNRKDLMMPSNDGFYNCKVVSNEKEAIGLRSIHIEVPQTVFESFKVPGQYVKVRPQKPEAKPSYFAIASSPRKVVNADADANTVSNIFHFLIKETPNNDFLLDQSSSSLPIEMSCALGNGFTIEEAFDRYNYDFPTNNILLIATGSGLAPIASAIDSKLLKLKAQQYNSLFPRSAKLYIGAKTPDHLPFQAKFSEWKDQGIEVIPVYSKLEEIKSLSDYRKGYVQQIVKDDGIVAPRNSGVLLCGQSAMMQAVKEICLVAGVFEGRILQNF